MKLLDILTEKEMSDNATATKPLGNVVFADMDNDPAFAKLQGYKPHSERNTKFEDDLANALSAWTLEPASGMKFLNKERDKIFQLKKKYPIIFKPNVSNGTVMYRGVNDISKLTLTQLRSSKIQDWTRLKEDYWLYKKPIDYKPRSPIQSWTYDYSTGQDFAGEGMLVTNLIDSEFLLNSKVLRIFFYSDEKEILHFGKEYKNKIYIALEPDFYEDKVRRFLLDPSGKGLSFKKFNPKTFKNK